MDELTHNSGKPETMNPHYNGKNGKNFLKRGKQEKHAELFRKDLISAMKMADSENLQPDDYLKILDPWKGEWEKGVQVPVNPNAFTPIFNDVRDYHKKESFDLFFLPKNFLHSLDQMNENFKPAIHEPYSLLLQQQNQCAYDLDEVDVAWLSVYNQSRMHFGDVELSEEDMERIVEELEVQTRNLLGQKLEDVERLGREYDESVVCDVCRSPEGEEDNEMVFCDNCDICVHQACYGIQEIPDGSWLCRTCSINIKPKCLLCSQTGGAMKCTREGDKWAHISCALWIPEVSIGCPEKMEPITDLDLVLPSRWTLLCVLCKQDSGACIQCSVKSCKVSFHVTCAFRHNLNLTTVIDDETEDVQMKAYCPLHSGLQSDSDDKANGEDTVGRKGKRNKEVFTEQMKKEKLRQIAEDFHKVVNLEDIRSSVDLPFDLVSAVFEYWKLKRRSQFDKPLISMNVEEEDEDEEKEDENQNEWMRHMMMKMRMFVQLRQDLERVRNLCYMVSKREKTSRRLQRNKEEIFSLQKKLYNNLSKHNGDISDDKMVSEKFKSKSEGAMVNHRLSDSDYDIYDDDDDGLRRSVIMKYKRENSDEENFDDDDSRVIFNNNSDLENDETKLKEDIKEDDSFEKMTATDLKWLQGAHKSSGSLYDDPSFVLSCNFQDDDHVDCRLNRRLVDLSSLPLNLFRDEDIDVNIKSNIIHKNTNHKLLTESHATPSSHSFSNNHTSFNNINNRANHSRKNFDDDYLVDSLGEEEDDNKSFNKGSKVDLREREWVRRKKMVNKVKGVRGRPKKKRGRPPKNAPPASPSIKDEDEVDKEDEEKEEVKEDYEDDDSDYYRRLSDEDIDGIVKPSPINKKINTPTSTGAKKLNKGGRPRKVESAGSLNNVKNDVTVPKKKRGRKRKSELPANASINKINEEDDLELPKKRKYTRRSERKDSFDRKDTKGRLDESDEHTKVSHSLTSSLSSSPSVHEVFGSSGNKKGLHKRGSRVAFDSDDDDDDVSLNDDLSDNDSKYEQSSNHTKLMKNNLDKSDVQNGIDEKPHIKTTEIENSDMFSSSDSEKEDNSLVENLLSRSRKKYKQANDRSSSVLLHDLELSDSEDEDNEERRKKAADFKIDNEKGNNGADENNAESKWVESPTPIYPPVTKVASLLSKGCIIPEEKVSSSDEDEDDDLYATKTSNLSTEKPKSDSKKTGIKNQDLLNIKIKQILLHKLPSKEFIVSSHLKSVVRDFFCGLDNNGKSDYKFSFNGFNLPQEKIVC